VQTKRKDWKLTLSGESNFGQLLKFYTENNTEVEVEDLLVDLYATTTSMLIDMKFKRHISDYFNDMLQDAEILEEITDEEDAKNLKIVKDDLSAETASTDDGQSKD